MALRTEGEAEELVVGGSFVAISGFWGLGVVGLILLLRVVKSCCIVIVVVGSPLGLRVVGYCGLILVEL